MFEDQLNDVWVTVTMSQGEGPPHDYVPFDSRARDCIRVTPWKPLSADPDTPEGILWVACFRREPHELEVLAAAGTLDDKQLIEMLLAELRRLRG
jgi:hypothetical protein